MIPLTMAERGDPVTIRKITGRDDVRQHLAELGFVVDTEITVVAELLWMMPVTITPAKIPSSGLLPSTRKIVAKIGASL